jgi:hypothetical protein
VGNDILWNKFCRLMLWALIFCGTNSTGLGCEYWYFTEQILQVWVVSSGIVRNKFYRFGLLALVLRGTNSVG